MGLTHRPPHGGGGHSAWCAWLAKDLDYSFHHAPDGYSATDACSSGAAARRSIGVTRAADPVDDHGALETRSSGAAACST